MNKRSSVGSHTNHKAYIIIHVSDKAQINKFHVSSLSPPTPGPGESGLLFSNHNTNYERETQTWWPATREGGRWIIVVGGGGGGDDAKGQMDGVGGMVLS